MNQMIKKLRGTVIVSCQAREGEPFNAPHFIVELAKSAEMAGASALRINKGENIKAVKKSVKIPIIGIRKRSIEGSNVFVTPSFKDIQEVIDAGADIVAMDATINRKEHGDSLRQLIDYCHTHNKPVLADIASIEDAEYAVSQGADLLATTLRGHTEETKEINIPDFEFLKLLTAKYSLPVFLEGGITVPDQVTRAMEVGAYGVIVGKAITMPHFIASQFVKQAQSFYLKGEYDSNSNCFL
jgi:N-acylglucosamine-6-phosphate 2-epimerase